MRIFAYVDYLKMIIKMTDIHVYFILYKQSIQKTIIFFSMGKGEKGFRSSSYVHSACIKVYGNPEYIDFQQ